MTEMLVYRCQRDPDAPARARAVLTGVLGGVELRVAGDVNTQLRTPSAGGGRGLRIVDSCAARRGVEEGSTHVWFEVDLEDPCES